MKPSSLRHFSPPAFFFAASLAGGIVAGTTTVHGLTPTPYGQAEAVGRLTNRSGQDVSPVAEQESASDCDGCSERDLGYHWASIRQVGSISDCPMESWDFRRGCVAYMRDTGGV